MESKPKPSAQIQLMQRIKDALPPNLSFVDELADLLGISNDSAYRRIRGETALTIEEIALLCKRYKFSFDTFLGSNTSGFVNFSYSPLSNNLVTYKEYLQRINGDMTKINASKEKEIIYAAVDVPLFNHFSQKELAAFKIFYWTKSILSASEYENKKFSFDVVDDEILQLASDIYDKYVQIPSVEIWSDDTLNSTIKQIEFYWESGLFKSKDDALFICNQVNNMMERLNKQCETAIKYNQDGSPASDKPNFKMYQSDVMIGNNCILVSMHGIKATYISYHTFNALSTISGIFCDETDAWLHNLIKKSNLISGIGEKQRYRFFNHTTCNLQKLIDKIKHS
jgi:transcriptional regulator with XRE-family HTH domain